ncbi:MAG: aromatic ring-hydroxylating dioxygenase subunit alpha, partial [Thermoplasmata archaeon]|nr:aromatic ring-hydroxylating dioxygenase subunit alpha [Thermoplasmata archaeon]
MSAPAEPSAHRSATTPPGRIYHDPAVLATELDSIFYRRWLCVGRAEQLANIGDYLTCQIGSEHLLIVRTPAGEVHGFYNLCRHRGTRVALEPEGTSAKSFVCPYHAWSYDLDGRLIGAPHTRGLENFDRDEFGLHRVRVEDVGGFLFVNLSRTGPSLADDLGAFFARFSRVPFAGLRLGHRQRYEVEANWKLLVENFSECYHCAPVHPNLNRLTPYLSGDNDAYFGTGAGRSLFAGGYMEFTKDFTSMTRSGYTRRPPIPGLSESDRRRVYYYVVFPNLLFSLHPDYLMVHRAWPTSPSHTRVDNEFYFAPETRADPE